MNAGDDDGVILDESSAMDVHSGKSRRRKRDGSGHSKRKHSKKAKHEQTRNPNELLHDIKAQNVYSYAPLPDPKNLAGKPEMLIYSKYKVRKHLIKTAQPYQMSSNLTTESFLQFTITSNKNEWIRFKPDGLSIVIFGVGNNAAYNAAGADEQTRSQVLALLARSGTPKMWIDPSVGMSGFVKSVECTIDNVPVPTNSTISNLFLQYIRFSRIFCKKPSAYIARTKQLTFANDRLNDKMKSPMSEATEPFDYKTWNSKVGVRSPIYLDGIFPFSLKNKTLEAIENKRAEHLWFAPNVTVDIRVHLHRSKMEAIFHSGINSFAEYFSTTAAVNAPTEEPKISISSACLEYEVAELNQEDHVACLKEFAQGRTGHYKYDIARGQHQPLPPNMSFTQNVFQILPFCKLIYIAFLPDWATFVMENKRRPLSGFSKYPVHCSKMNVTFASEPLITKEFEGFGSRYTQHEISKKIEYQYKRKLGITTGSFQDFFPRSSSGGGETEDDSLIQVLVFELSNQVSTKSEFLQIECTFGGGHTSPVEQQIVVISVHPNGEAICVQRPGTDQWQWSFAQNA